MSWRLAGALVSLRNGVNAKWPKRDKRSDGTIGNPAHAKNGSASDHNPWITVAGLGVVRAIDIDVDGINAAWLAEQLRIAGDAMDRRLINGGYVIYNRRITKADFSGWSVYRGANPHTSHVHVSFSRNSGFDDTRPWAFLGPAKPARPTIRRGSSGRYVRDLQARLRTVYPAYAGNLVVDGVFGAATEKAVCEFQRRSGLPVDGVVGPKTWRAMGF